jgi:hypothetical protein
MRFGLSPNKQKGRAIAFTNFLAKTPIFQKPGFLNNTFAKTKNALICSRVERSGTRHLQYARNPVEKTGFLITKLLAIYEFVNRVP